MNMPEQQQPMDPNDKMDPNVQAIDRNSQPITPEQRQTLLDAIGKVKGEIDNVGATRFASGQKSDLNRQKTLQKVFKSLQRAGVDLNSRESVASFIMNVKKRNPKLAENFEKAMDQLMGGESMEAPQDENNMNNINQNEEIPEGQPGSA